MTEVNDITEALHKEIEAVPEADRALLLSLVRSYREGTSKAYDRWFEKAVEIGKRQASEDKVVDHADVRSRWQARRAAQMD